MGSEMCIRDRCWCGQTNRIEIGRDMSLEDCKANCNEDTECNGIEHWAKGSMFCFRCLNTDQTSAFTHTGDRGYPPSVYIKGNRQ